jgi:1-aminocyclopropane-1-carboxylate deaminase/D-cysteine desulfhydrase-like pyridoxal-dependent ACC family enzyme
VGSGSPSGPDAFDGLASLPGLVLPRAPLGRLPTAIVPLAPGLWGFDESAVSPSYGGNKLRKLEDILTFGAAGSHHAIAVAVHAAPLGVRTRVVLLPQADTPHARANLARTASLAVAYPTAAAAAPCAVARAFRDVHRAGGRMYVIPVGASNAYGTVGWVGAGLEIAEAVRAGRLPRPAHVVVASGSGGTAAGLWEGARLGGLDTHVVAVDVSGMPLARVWLGVLASGARARLRRHGARLPAQSGATLTVDRSWVLDGYGRPHPSVDAAIEAARTYTARSFGAALALVRGGSGPVLWVNTFSRVAPPPGEADLAPHLSALLRR